MGRCRRRRAPPRVQGVVQHSTRKGGAAGLPPRVINYLQLGQAGRGVNFSAFVFIPVLTCLLAASSRM